MATNTPRINLTKPDPLESMAAVGTWLNPNMDKLDSFAGIQHIADEFGFPASPYTGQMVFITGGSNAFKGAYMQWTGSAWRHRARKGAGFQRSVTNLSTPSGDALVDFTGGTTDSVNFTATSGLVMTAINAGLYLISWNVKFEPYDRTLTFEKFASMQVRNAADVVQFGSSDGNGIQEGPTAGTTFYSMSGTLCGPMDVGWDIVLNVFQGSGASKLLTYVKLNCQLIGTDVTYTAAV